MRMQFRISKTAWLISLPIPKLATLNPILLLLQATTFFLLFGLSIDANGQSDAGKSILARAGMDIALLENVRNGSLQAFTENENTLFESLAKTIIRLDSLPAEPGSQAFDLLEALQNPDQYRGKYVQVRGHVRRVSTIQITTTRLQKATGRKEYFQVDLFVPTNKTQFHLKDSQGEVTIGGTFGITLILFDLPDLFLETKQITVTVPGFFLKNWSHKTVDTRAVFQ